MPMHAQLPSLTAAIVAAARDIASWNRPNNLGIDHVARHLLPVPIASGLRRLSDVASRVPALAPAVRLATFGVVEHLAWRTELLDRTVADVAGGRVRQLVILGAGLDARAWRMAELRSTTVFEVDHPATHSWKRLKIAGLRSEAADVRLVEVDFQRQKIGAQLAAAGHDAGQPTLWLWEGVTMYLTPHAIAATLTDLARRSAPGSVVAMSYLTPDVVNLPGFLHPLVRLGFVAMGEPLTGTLSPRQAIDSVEFNGFSVQSDVGSPVRLFACERVLVTQPRQ